MIKPAQAQQELDKVRLEKGGDASLKSLGRLPASARTIGHGILGRQPDGKEFRDWLKRAQARREAAALLDRESPAQRIKLFSALFPKLEVQVEAAWQLLGTLPYQTGYLRKAFRAPRHRVYTHVRAGNWLEWLHMGASQFQQDVAWWAAWTPHHDDGDVQDAMPVLFAGTINAGGKVGNEVFDILCASARNEHEIGGMGFHVARGLLAANRPDGWELMEKMLLAAQRQEGLRQTILESVDLAHPEAFRRMLRVILDHDLARFSSVVRAVDVWFGFEWDSASTRVVNEAIEHTLTYLDDEDARRKAMAKGEGDDLYLALWSLACEDAVAAVEAAAPLLGDKNAKRRFLATHLLVQLGLPPAHEALLPMLADEDLRIAWRAFHAFGGDEFEEDDGYSQPAQLFDRLEQLFARIPAKGLEAKALIWPWTAGKVQPRAIVETMRVSLGDRPPTRLIPYLKQMDPYSKGDFVAQLARQKKWDAVTRDTLFALVGDTSADVREEAVQALSKCKISEEEAEGLEGLLTRKANDLRRGVLALLLKQTDSAALASAERLLVSNDQLQRLAGLEILRELSAAKRKPDVCKARIEKFQGDRPRITKDEQRALDALADAGQDKPTLDNALGLLDPGQRTKPTPPKPRLALPLITPAAVELVKSLVDFIHEHRELEVIVKERPRESDPDDEYFEDDGWDDPQDMEGGKPELLGEMTYSFPSPDARFTAEEDVQYLPLANLWQEWWRDRAKETRDKDGLELLRALAFLKKVEQEDWLDELSVALKKAGKACFGDAKVKNLRYDHVVEEVLRWMVRLQRLAGAADFLLDAVETSFALVPAEELTKVRAANDRDLDYDDDLVDWRDGFGSPFKIMANEAENHRTFCLRDWTDKHHVRFYRLLNWKDLSVPGIGRAKPEFEDVLRAYKAGGATRADLLDLILGPKDADSYSGFSHLSDLTERKRRVGWVKELPELLEMAEACRQRILEIELARGDTSTAASAPAQSLSSVWGIDTLVRILQALGNQKFHRGYVFNDNVGKACVLTHLVSVCYPAELDTPEIFAERMRVAEIPEDRLVELAFKAPQWVKFVERTLGWQGFAEGVWWFLAHTRDSVQESDKAWKALMSERTALTPTELFAGAVDVAWFHRAYEAVGPKRWPTLDEAAKYASEAGGYRRARFLASVLLGQAKKSALIADIKKKFLKESVRALGLLPLAAGAGRDKDLSERYEVLQEYHRYARGLSALSRDAAVKAAEVGIANLARTAGYPDPIRFQWAMEAAACADLPQGVAARAGDVEVSLAVDADGQIQWNVLRKGKSVKSIPPAQRKDKKIAALVQRKKDLARSQSRMRRGLEDMMCRGDTFTGAELLQLMQHPLLAPMLARLVVLGDGILGYPEKKGQALRNHAGKLEPVKKSEPLRLAHPHDLFEGGAWHHWQHDAFQREIVQPFKQVFRELYIVTAAEKKQGNPSLRYAGQQVQPRQALALWGGRGWSVNHDEGIGKTFHSEGITACVTSEHTAGTAAEVEGWTLEGVAFARVADHKPMKLSDVPPRLFSEVMRDMDLVVSVAHRGGVDPEASASTVEMRANLLRELCSLLKLRNVRQKNQHVLIDGQLGKYSIHLGSGGAHRMPGGALFIIPVHAQHRGRLFLPFADDDPKTAEILSKVLLLARDGEIQDPSVSEQLRR